MPFALKGFRWPYYQNSNGTLDELGSVNYENILGNMFDINNAQDSISLWMFSCENWFLCKVNQRIDLKRWDVSIILYDGDSLLTFKFLCDYQLEFGWTYTYTLV